MDEEMQRRLEELPWLLKIKYKQTPEQVAIVERFKSWCLRNTDNSYIMGIDKLLQLADSDWKYESLYGEIVSIKEIISAHSEKLEQKVESTVKKPKTFGE